MLKIDGPVLLACNHPNSFLDSVILDLLFEKPVWSLARGDVFKNKLLVRILTSLKILPVYRTSEGVENLGENYRTFNACIDLFRKNNIITIFSEGKCVNEWHLRPLKKGTARLAIKAWEEGIPLRVLPVGINYSSFRKFGKNVFIQIGTFIEAGEIDMNDTDGNRHNAFNHLLNQQLKELVWEIPANDIERKTTLLTVKISPLKKSILAIPSMLGWLLHAPLYIPVKSFTWKRTHSNDHYDSVMTTLLLFSYALYLLMLTGIAWIITGSPWALLLPVLMPLTAWAHVQLKSQLDK